MTLNKWCQHMRQVSPGKQDGKMGPYISYTVQKQLAGWLLQKPAPRTQVGVFLGMHVEGEGRSLGL